MDFIEAQTKVVQAVVASATVGAWRRLLANLEMLEHGDDFQFDYVCLAVVGDDDALDTRQFQLNADAERAAIDLYRQRRDEAGETIGGFEVVIDSDGRYRIELDHGAPKRLNGEWDEAREGRLDHYLDHYRAEIADQRGER